MRIAKPFWVLGITILALTGCRTPRQEPPPHLPPSSLGVRISRTGEAVAEVKLPPDLVFETCESYLKKKMTVTFVNRPREIDSEYRNVQFFTTIVSLTSGKTAVSVAAQRRDQTLDYQSAQNLANDLMLELKSISKPIGVPFRTQTIAPREE